MSAPCQARAPFRVAGERVTVRVRLSPRAAADRIDGLITDADGDVALKLGVTAPAEGGKANRALVALLAKEWRLAKAALTLVGGQTNRRKVVSVAGNPAAVLARLENWARDKGLTGGA